MAFNTNFGNIILSGQKALKIMSRVLKRAIFGATIGLIWTFTSNKGVWYG